MSKGKRDQACFAKCQIEPGMFKEEWLVFLEAINPENRDERIKVQLFVDQRDVRQLSGTPRRNRPASGFLRVFLVRNIGDIAQVVLPQPSTPLGENVYLEKKEVVTSCP